MEKLKKPKATIRKDITIESDYIDCIKDVVNRDVLWRMSNYPHHGEYSCLDHCFHVSYLSYKICKKLNFDYCSTARGALLHDLFLYDWHTDKPLEGLHGFVHPRIALQNADDHFELNEIERDIIVKHMWPLTIVFPKYKESFIVQLVDKYCAIIETFNRRDIIENTLLNEFVKLLANEL
jgi:uncharacterized protein